MDVSPLLGDSLAPPDEQEPVPRYVSLEPRWWQFLKPMGPNLLLVIGALLVTFLYTSRQQREKQDQDELAFKRQQITRATELWIQEGSASRAIPLLSDLGEPAVGTLLAILIEAHPRSVVGTTPTGSAIASADDFFDSSQSLLRMGAPGINALLRRIKEDGRISTRIACTRAFQTITLSKGTLLNAVEKSLKGILADESEPAELRREAFASLLFQNIRDFDLAYVDDLTISPDVPLRLGRIRWKSGRLSLLAASRLSLSEQKEADQGSEFGTAGTGRGRPGVTILIRADIRDARLMHCKFHNVHLHGGRYSTVDGLVRCNGYGVFFTGSQFVHCHIDHLVLQTPRFDAAVIRDCQFSYCSLARSNWIGETTVITDTVFDDCDLRSAEFKDVHFRNVRFVRCHLEDTQFHGAVASSISFERCHVGKAQFGGSNITRAVFADCEGLDSASF